MTEPDAAAATRDLWSQGHYEIVGDWFADASRAVLDGPQGPLALDGRSLLDAACGTGAVAIAAAEAGASVTGLDITPDMLAEARRRAVAAGVQVDLVERSFDDLAGLGAFDVVTSAFGVMFSPDPTTTAGALASVLADDGRIAVAAWHPDGAFGSMPDDLRDLLPAGGVDTYPWADADAVDAFFADTAVAVSHRAARSVPVPFPSAEEAVSALRAHAAPWMRAFSHLEQIGEAERAQRILTAHLAERSDPTPDGIALRADFVVTHLSTP